jgi:anti-sigma B factor antagonist
MAKDRLEFEIRDGSALGVRVAVLRGALTISALSTFQEFTHSDQSEKLIIDMSAVPYMDSGGLGSIIGAHVSRERQARKLVLAGVSDRVHLVMTVSGVAGLFQLYPTAADAEAALVSP